MTTIDRGSRLLEHLRTHLQADQTNEPLAVLAAGRSAAGSARQSKGAYAAVEMVQRLHSAGVSDERVLVSRLIEGLMLEQFGTDTQGANFQFVLSQVVQTLEQDPEAWALCRECVAEAIG